MRSGSLLILPFLVFIAGDAEASAPPNLDRWLQGSAPTVTTSAPDPRVAAVDPDRGVPSFVLLGADGPAQRGSSVRLARAALRRHRDLYRAGDAAIRGARHRFTHDTGRGPRIVVLRQTVAGVDVFHGDLKVLLDRRGRARAISGALHPAATPASARPFVIDAEAAIDAALRDLYPELGDTPSLRPTEARGGWRYFDLAASASLHAAAPPRIKRVYFPRGDALAPAYFVELQTQLGAGELDVIQYVVAADDGELFYRRDATAYEAYQYRVWADEGGDLRPHDGPMINYTPHPTGVPGEGPKDFTAPALITIDGFNELGDPWLPKGATETKGNNVDAYIDHSNPDGLSGDEFRASITADGVFDYVYDVGLEPLANTTQSMAAIVQIFYTVNWMHDWWYDSGFTEAAGNAQSDNYGRGGVDGDPLKAEAQDAALLGARNNANMATPADGASPRMQMYLWSAPSESSLSVAPLAENYPVGDAAFGPKNFDITAPIVVIDDGDGSATDGCQPAQNALAGHIALIDRGSCTFETKAKNALDAGAIAVLIANNQGGGTPPTLGNDQNLADPQIATQGITKAAGDAIKAALMGEPQTGHMIRTSGVERDGTIDNMIVAHEWGHYIHHRLVECGSQQCGAESEGWGDFAALHMSLRDGDDLDGVYPGVTYASLDSTGYYGIRRVPYSVDMTKNALTFRHIAQGEALPMGHPLKNNGITNAEVHNAGEVWATMMWESYVALQKAYQGEGKSFDDARRAMSDYIVAGMILAPSAPTYTEQRDAILAAAAAVSLDDMTTIAGAFATRGAGTCAESPPKASSDLVGVVEDFELRARATIADVTVDDSLLSCDEDGVLDVEEVGAIRATITNVGAGTLAAGATVEVLDPDVNLVFLDGTSVALPELAPQASFEAVIPIALDEAVSDYLALPLDLRLTAPGSCDELLDTSLLTVVHGDVLAESSTIDDVEPPLTAWTAGGLDGEAIWARTLTVDGYVWHGDDVGRVSDTWLASPVLKVAADEPLVVTLDHAYSFEFSENTYWDGGVIEISSDDGATWEDVAIYSDPGYPGAIDSGLNPLNTRPAFVSDSPSYPDLEPLVLDFGMAFAGEAVKLRMRIGTDGAAGGPGWDIDNVTIDGITNTPFAVWVADQGMCAGGTDTDTDSGGTDSDSAGTDSGSAGTDSDSFGTDSTTMDSTWTAGESDSGETTGAATTGGPSTTGGPTSAGTSAGPSGSASDTDDSATGTDTAGQGPLADDGCGCRAQDRGPGGALLGLALLGFMRRRRRA